MASESLFYLLSLLLFSSFTLSTPAVRLAASAWRRFRSSQIVSPELNQRKNKYLRGFQMYNFGLGLRGILHIVRLYPAAVSAEAAVDMLWRRRDRRWTGNKREMEWRRSLPPACSAPVAVYYFFPPIKPQEKPIKRETGVCSLLLCTFSHHPSSGF